MDNPQADTRMYVWVGLKRHHKESARDLPASTVEILDRLVRGETWSSENLKLEALFQPSGKLEGFGVVLKRLENPTETSHAVYTATPPSRFRNEVQAVRALFRKLGFTRQASLYVSTVKPQSPDA